jgi:hemolysin III
MTLYTISKEETANSITHGFGVILSIIGIVYFLKLGLINGTFLQTFCLLVFGFSLLLLYSFSTLYHLTTEGTTFKRTMQKLDHSAIFLLIAGSYTPIISMTVDGVIGSIILVIVWAIGLLGIFLEQFNLMKSKKLSLALYLIMGWVAVFVIKDIFLNMPMSSFILLVLGGVFYTLGVYFYVQKTKAYYHALWHIFVLMGSLSHYLCVLILFYSVSIPIVHGISV